MPDDRSERLESLISQATRSLRSLTGRSSAITSVPTPLSISSTVARRPAVSGIGSNPLGGTPYLDDERQIRALAKEIKRLIAEDSRRGLRVLEKF